MTRGSQTIRYLGQVIVNCYQFGVGGCTGRGWHVKTYHDKTGMPYSEELTPWYRTLAEAKTAIQRGEFAANPGD